MDVMLALLAAGVAFAVGAGIAWLLRGREIASLAEQKTRLEQAIGDAQAQCETWRLKAEATIQSLAAATAKANEADGLKAELAAATQTIIGLRAELAGIQAKAAEQAASSDQQIASLVALRDQVLKDFQRLAGEVLKVNAASFITLANETFEKHRASATAELEKKQDAISTLLKPVSEALEKYQTRLIEVEKARQEAYGSVTTELHQVAYAQNQVRLETSKLVNALRAAPKTRGRWGEHQLRNVLELAGMAEHCDFTVETTYDSNDGKVRPDVIIRLPGDRCIVVDAKTACSAYLDAVEAADDTIREQHLQLHAQQLRAHMRELAAKSYWDALSVSPDVVVMFVPGDNFFAAAMERDPSLFEDAVQSRVLIATPTTLIALAKAVAYGWRQQRIAEGAAVVAELGKELYKRLTVMGDHIVAVGNTLAKSVEHYNKFIGSLEGSVFPQARRFADLKVGTGPATLATLEPIEIDVREARADRDLVLPAPANPPASPPVTDSSAQVSASGHAS